MKASFDFTEQIITLEDEWTTEELQKLIKDYAGWRVRGVYSITPTIPTLPEYPFPWYPCIVTC